MEENNTEISERVSKKKRVEKVRENPWIISSFVLGILVVILLVGNFSITGHAVSSSEAEDIFYSYFDAVGADVSDFEITDISKKNGLYEIYFEYKGEEYPYPYYLTKDGSLIGTLYETEGILEEEESSDSGTTSVPKSDKPVVELFIWGYCPYGVQAQGPLVEVADLLSDYADFKVVMYYDGHGEYETQENMIQECIQELYPDKYWDYAAGFVDEVYPACSSERTVDCDKTEAIKVMNSLGINSAKVFSCVDSKGESLLSKASARASELRITGSPSLVINGVKVNSARNAEAFKAAVCDAFNEVPEACSVTLSSGTTTASGSC